MMSQVLDLDNLCSAWKEVRKNRGSAGGDLAERVQTGAYQPGKVRVITVYTGGKEREIAIWCVADRVLQRALMQVIEPLFERIFLPCSFGYRRNRSVADAVRRIILLRDGRTRAARRSRQPRGISLGAVISPLLCNVYLHELDKSLRKERLQSIRYADDFIVLCRTSVERDSALGIVQAILKSLILGINTQKTRLTSFKEGFKFLGVTFKGKKYSYHWHNKRVEASDTGETFPLDVDGYR